MFQVRLPACPLIFPICAAVAAVASAQHYSHCLLFVDCMPAPVVRQLPSQTRPLPQGLFGVARRFYLLFQHHTTDAFNAQAKEFLGPNDGAEFHFLRYMGPQVGGAGELLGGAEVRG